MSGQVATPAPALKDQSMSLWDLADLIITDWCRMLRLALLLLGGSGILCLALGLAFHIVARNRLEIIQPATGGVMYRLGGADRALIFLLGASAPWAPTEFEVRKGDNLEISASGQVCLSIHHLVEAAKSDTRPPHGWADPSGLPQSLKWKIFQKQDYWRERYLLVPNEPYGALVATVVPPGKTQPEPNSAFLVGRHWSGTAPASGRLWFAVNDVILTPDTREAYDIPEGQKESGYNVPRSFCQITYDQYWNLWYDDNVGSFLIVVRKE